MRGNGGEVDSHAINSPSGHGQRLGTTGFSALLNVSRLNTATTGYVCSLYLYDVGITPYSFSLVPITSYNVLNDVPNESGHCCTLLGYVASRDQADTEGGV